MCQLSGSHEIFQAVSYVAKELQERTQAQGLGKSLWRHHLWLPVPRPIPPAGTSVPFPRMISLGVG